jgi:hypothetical protein
VAFFDDATQGLRAVQGTGKPLPSASSIARLPIIDVPPVTSAFGMQYASHRPSGHACIAQEAGMNIQRRSFLLFVTLAAAAAMAAPTASGAQSGASIPDMSGVWLHPSGPGFEPLSSGPTSIVNRSRINGTGNINQLVGDYTNPILKPAAAEVVKKHGEIMLSGAGYPDPRNQCTPQGVPYVFTSGGIQLLQQPDKITILYDYDHQVRHIRMNQSHPNHVAPSWYGDSVGHYEGDTLVIDTVGFKIGPFSMVDRFGTPHTEALHVVERYRLLDYEAAKEGMERDAKENFRPQPETVDRSKSGKYLQLQFTVEDDGVFTVPWSATITYGRPFVEWSEFVCAENTQWFPGTEAAIPTADKPDF